MFKRLLMIAVAMTVPVAMMAQEPPPIAIVAHVLSLSEEQVHALAELLQARGEALRPAMEELQRHQKALEEQLNAADPDVATVGRLAVEMKKLQEQVQHALEESNKALDGILNDEQRTRLEQLRGAAGACGVIPAFRAIGLL
jgi:ABC-type transporter Mla subunit MlaD